MQPKVKLIQSINKCWGGGVRGKTEEGDGSLLGHGEAPPQKEKVNSRQCLVDL